MIAPDTPVEVYVVDLVGEPDPLYVFSKREDAERFYETELRSRNNEGVVFSEEPVIDTQGAEALIEEMAA